MNFLGGATSLDSFLEDYNAKETKGFFPTNGMIVRRKWTTNTFLPVTPSLAFCAIVNSNPLEKDYNYLQNLVNGDITTEQAVAKLRKERILPTGDENYSQLQSVWENKNMQDFPDFLKWYNKKDVVPTLQLMQKMIEI